MNHLRNILIVLFVLFLESAGWSHPSSSPVKITLLTEGPGYELASVYGHTGLRIREVNTGRDYVFHYGLYDFDTPGFYRHFLNGILLYKMGGQTFDSFYRMSMEEGRSLYEQDLALDSAQSMELYNLLHDNYKEENRQYYYDFLYDNCSTRPRDLLERVWRGRLHYPDMPQKTLRQLLSEFQSRLPWIDYGIDLIIGSEVDTLVHARAQCFLPMYLMRILEQSTLEGGPAVPASQELYNAPEKRPFPRYLKPVFVLGFLLILEIGLILLYRKKKTPKWLVIYDWILFAIIGGMSLFIMFLWWGTDHHITKNNWNILWLNPLFLLLIATRISIFRHLRHYISLSLVVLLCTALISGWMGIRTQPFHTASYLLLSILLIKLTRLVAKDNK